MEEKQRTDMEKTMIGFLGMVIDAMQRQADLMEKIGTELAVSNELKAREELRQSRGCVPDSGSVKVYLDSIRKDVAGK